MKTHISLLKTVALIVLLLLISADLNSQVLSVSRKSQVRTVKEDHVTAFRQSIPLMSSKEKFVTNNFPFLEDWQQGSFSYNGWLFLPSQGNWIVDPVSGNPAPCATFTGMPVVTNYSYSLLSPMLNASPYTCADLWLDFDLKLFDNFSTGTEKLDVDLYYNNNWVNLIEYNNTGTTDWSQQHLAIDSVRGKPFQIRFMASGASSSGIQSWYIDNIHTYAVCRGVSELEGHTPWGSLTTYVWWNHPICGPEYPIPQWIHWDSGESTNSIGTCACTFEVAARWTPDQIQYFQNGTLTKVKFWPSGAGNATYSVRIWEGANAANLVVDQPVNGFTNDQWNTVILSTPLQVNVSEELWVGLQVVLLGGYPVGVDSGPAIDGFGNMINWDGEWTTLTNLNPSLDYNWNIEAYIDAPPIDTLSTHILGYNIFRTPDGQTSPFTQLNTALIDSYEYLDTHSYYYPGSYWYYYVTAIYEDTTNPGNEICEGISDTILVGVTEGVGNNQVIKLSIFPNPASGNIEISANYLIEKMELFDCLGNVALRFPGMKQKKVSANVTGLRNGVYFARIRLNGTIVTERVVIIH
jgi:hypothetical protein